VGGHARVGVWRGRRRFRMSSRRDSVGGRGPGGTRPRRSGRSDASEPGPITRVSRHRRRHGRYRPRLHFRPARWAALAVASLAAAAVSIVRPIHSLIPDLSDEPADAVAASLLRWECRRRCVAGGQGARRCTGRAVHRGVGRSGHDRRRCFGRPRRHPGTR